MLDMEGEPHKRVTWLGHATVLVDLDGTKLLTDPVLRSLVMHLRRAWAPDQRALRGLDAVLVSHVHFDHLDLPSLERLGRDVPVVVPRGAGGLLRKKRFEHVLEVDVGEELRVGAVAVTATHAEHDADRGPLGTKAPSLGFVISGSRSVYFAGDTDLFPGMATIGPLDLALMPISGWGPKVGPGHLDPRRAAEALQLLRPSVCVPIHWGTYSPLSWGRAKRVAATLPPEEFRRAAAELAPDVRIEVLERNGTLDLA
jgi:L-ascorbate metabolism protein UlaG (beta-lactamase superfamily)